MSQRSWHPRRPMRTRVVGLLVLLVLLVLPGPSEAQTTPPPALLVDHGGRVLVAPQVNAIYLGDFWAAGQGASESTHANTFLQTWLGGPSITDVLAQYRVTSASFVSSTTAAGPAPLRVGRRRAEGELSRSVVQPICLHSHWPSARLMQMCSSSGWPSSPWTSHKRPLSGVMGSGSGPSPARRIPRWPA